MKFTAIYLSIILLSCTTLSFAQYVKYEVKVVLDSTKTVRGSLQKVSPQEIAVQDYSGNYYIFKASNIVKIKILRKGLTVGESVGTGAGIGLALGAAIFFTGDNFNDFGEKLAGTIFFTGVGAIGGTLGGLLAEAINTELVLRINTDPTKFNQGYLKLEKYSKAYDLDKPALLGSKSNP